MTTKCSLNLQIYHQ